MNATTQSTSALNQDEIASLAFRQAFNIWLPESSQPGANQQYKLPVEQRLEAAQQPAVRNEPKPAGPRKRNSSSRSTVVIL